VRFRLLYLNVTAGSVSVPNATVQLEVDGQVVRDAGLGHGPVDAAFKTICKMVKRFLRLVR
jgi:2-isopropylmalate synthase